MGKNMKNAKGSKKSSGSANQTPQPCLCEHAYLCTCGNRPERPSRGHKWDIATKTWTGKGHRQKGAGTTQVSTAAKITSVGQTVLQEWQRLPSQLLQEVCAREKKAKPKYDSVGKGKVYKFMVIVKDPEDELFFCPAKGAPNEEQAKEEAALLALLDLTPTLPHERKLPEPYKTTWLNVIKQKMPVASKAAPSKTVASKTAPSKTAFSKTAHSKTVPSKSNGRSSTNTSLSRDVAFTSRSEKQKFFEKVRIEKLARIRKHEALRMANRDHRVFMSATIRKSIERLLRGDETAVAVMEEAEEDDDDSDVLRTYVKQRLRQEGFSSESIRRSLEAKKLGGQDAVSEEDMDSAYEVCMQWLLIHLDEDQLPVGFDPRGGGLAVVKASAAPKTSKNVASSAIAKEEERPEIRSFASRYGISVQEAGLIVDKAITKSDPDGDRAVLKGLRQDILWNALIRASNVGDSALFLGGDDSNPDPSMGEVAAEELEALEAIFMQDCTVARLDRRTIVSIPIQSEDEDKPKQVLELQMVQGVYPNVFPKVFLKGGWRGKPSGFAVSKYLEIVQFLSELTLGEPMVYEVYCFVSSILSEGCEKNFRSSDASPLLPYLTQGITTQQNLTTPIDDTNSNNNRDQSKSNNLNGKRKTAPCRNNFSSLRRPKQKSPFWSRHPTKTAPAESFPKIPSDLADARNRLPAAKARQEFLNKMALCEKNGRVLLVTGETGCGKTTQIPQFILESAPVNSKIVIAQPRRLAATGVASRVAAERGEDAPGRRSVGCIVRGEVSMCDSTRLTFCTTGVLLRQLQSDGALDCITHIVVDEVHERNLDTDVLLAVLKVSLKSTPHLKVVLMSATMDADRFGGYFGAGTPRMHIPGFTHPVQDFNLYDVLQDTGYVPPRKKKKNGGGGRPNANRNKSEHKESTIKDDDDPSNDSRPKITIEDLVKRVDENNIDYDMVSALILRLLQTKHADNDDGSILVFLPGVGEISKAEQSLKKHSRNSHHNMSILPLHGGLQAKDQKRVFQNAPYGCTKVILATNVAETSITIPDCTMVVDTCKEKQSGYDPSNRMPMLIERFASRDSLKQRRGRAGRVRPGKYYQLLSTRTYENLPQHGEPEIKRCALDQTLLSLLFLGVENGTGTFLNKMLDPPTPEAINAAMTSLEKLGAVSNATGGQKDEKNLTPLGMHLAGIPAPPVVGKMLVMGSLLGCRSASLAMAAGMSVGRSPFLKIDTYRRKGEEETDETRRQDEIVLERKKMFDKIGNSDHALLGMAFLEWDRSYGTDQRHLAESLGLAFNGMRDMKQLVRQYDSALSLIGFLHSTESDRNVDSWRVIRSCVVSALAPSQIVRVQRPTTKYAETVEGAIEKDGQSQDLRFYVRSGMEPVMTGPDLQFSSITRQYNNIPEERVFVHPSSMNFKVGAYSCPWLVFNDLVRTSKPFLRDATECSAYALLLFGGKLDVQASNELIVVDDYVRLSAHARIGALIRGLRDKVDDLLAKKVIQPKLDIANSVEMTIITTLLLGDGLGK